MIAPQKSPAAPKAKKAPQSVAPAMQQEHGQGGHKQSGQIIHDFVLKQSGDPKAAAAVMKALADMIQKKTARLIQFGNTVFWATQKGPGTVDVHIFTEESPKVLVKRIQQAYQWAKDKGFKKITSTLTDGEMMKILKMAGLPYSVQQTTVNDGKQMVPAQIMTMEVK
jgi:hypothetical protein